ncbi:MAG TPA: sigma-70 family RNA polymerase sigma factor [Candidatus Omnitrophota bacterium]|nr:sigma-70 family RNA polymerase sigma factor [Candidatus Omnitrophota bacterium]HPT07660.1 sigma-70 family RNA polymerase sigma factor [Candidatus Omnitrophota bacterium]
MVNETSEPDGELIKRFQQSKQNTPAFDALITRYKNRIFHLCYRFLGNYEEANDSAQETFVKVYRALDTFRFESSFSTWIYRIAVNTCKNKLVSAEYRMRRRTSSIDTPLETSENDCPLEIADEKAQTGRGELEKKEKSAVIQAAIETLPEEQRSIVILRDIQGLSYEEISQITGFNLGTVKSKLARARCALKEKLQRIIS